MTDTRREFVDTNVLVYAHDTSPALAKRHTVAKSLLERLWDSRSGCLSTQVLQEFFTVVTRKIAQPISTDEAYAVVEDYASWTLHRPTGADILEAIRIHQRNQISFWDALIMQSASAMHCATIWSEDLHAGQTIAEVTIVNPFLT